MRHPLFAILCLLLLAGCAQNQAAPPDEVTLQLKWLHSAQFAGFYIAETQGYYAEENIVIEMRQWDFDVQIIDEVASGQAQFGIWLSDSLLASRAKGQPIKAIAAIFQTSSTNDGKET